MSDANVEPASQLVNAMTPKSRPILFSGEMIRALLDGRKTQTRRVVKGFPNGGSVQKLTDGSWEHSPDGGFDHHVTRVECPYGQPGDTLWVKETFQRSDLCARHKIYDRNNIWYLATDEKPPHVHGWRPSIFMPRWASRITLGIESVRVERVQDISEEDAKAEGVHTIAYQDNPFLTGALNARPNGERSTHRTEFRNLWESINGKREGGKYSWAANPWCWVLQFPKP